MALMVLLMFLFMVIMGGVFFVLVSLLSYFYGGVLYSKSSGFECGFQPFLHSGNPFSMPFFVISLMFLLFDVEIILMSFPPFSGGAYSVFFWGVIFLVFFATCYEWWWGILSWLSS